MKKYFIESLGCPKNRVDSEIFAYILEKHGFVSTELPKEADILLVNSCSFIYDAMQELADYLDVYSYLRTQSSKMRLIVTGCITKRGLRDFKRMFPAVDAWVDLKDFNTFEKIIATRSEGKYYRSDWQNLPYAYLRISDGCNNKCSYCTIPSIRGTMKSVPMDELVREAVYLVNKGVVELILVAQDVAAYGRDIYRKQMLIELLVRLHEIPGLKWIRLMYLHPAHLKLDWFDKLVLLPKILPAFEIPIQHCNDNILSTMNRKHNKDKLISLYNKIYSVFPEAVIRTTIITGLPGETNKKFKELIEFLTTYSFMRMGVFIYSSEPGTKAFNMPNRPSDRTAIKRQNEILTLQQAITETWLESYIGRAVPVIVENANTEEPDSWIGRAWFDAPEIDGVVYINGKNLKIGSIINVLIEDVIDIDLFGSVV